MENARRRARGSRVGESGRQRDEGRVASARRRGGGVKVVGKRRARGVAGAPHRGGSAGVGEQRLATWSLGGGEAEKRSRAGGLAGAHWGRRRGGGLRPLGRRRQSTEFGGRVFSRLRTFEINGHLCLVPFRTSLGGPNPREAVQPPPSQSHWSLP